MTLPSTLRGFALGDRLNIACNTEMSMGWGSCVKPKKPKKTKQQLALERHRALGEKYFTPNRRASEDRRRRQGDQELRCQDTTHCNMRGSAL